MQIGKEEVDICSLLLGSSNRSPARVLKSLSTVIVAPGTPENFARAPAFKVKAPADFFIFKIPFPRTVSSPFGID